MNDFAPRHPGAQVMAAFLEGTLPPKQIAAVADHLRACADCRTVVAETARFEREEERFAAPRPQRAWTSWLAVAAVLAAVAVAAPFLLLRIESRRAPIARLIAAAPREHRRVEVRLSGFRWARLQAPVRSGSAVADPSDLKLNGAAGDVLETTEARRDAEGSHATGVAFLLIGRRSESVTALERAAREANDPKIWNDLAAARYTFAADEGQPLLPEALADADRALRLDPKNAEALFNRALILEHLGTREQARQAWQRYLDVDPNSAWSVEARTHLRSLGSTSRRFDRKMLDGTPSAQLVRSFPNETRAWGEGPLLADWADAAAAGDEARASAILARTRTIADALAAYNGEHLLDDAVAVAERSAGPSRRTLIDAHRLYRDARKEYNKQNLGSAETQLRRAAELFARAGSPMSGLASYFAASAAFDQSRDVHDELASLAARVDAARHRDLAAQIHRTLALNAIRAADWGAAIRHGDAASAVFRALGEQGNAAVTDSIAAYALELIGAGDAAWTRRARALAVFCDGSDRMHCNAVLNDTATALASIDRTDAALAIANLTVEDPAADPANAAMTLAKHMRVMARTSDGDSVRRSLSEARRAAERVGDPALRALLNAQIEVEEAALQTRKDPAAAIARLDRAVAFFTGHPVAYLLPYVHLQRARAWRAAGNRDAAASDYAAALRTTTAQQSFIDDPALRFAFLDTATEALDEGIDLELSRGATAAAFGMADRRHALAAAAAVPSLDPGVALIEYAVLPRSLIIFCLTGGRMTETAVAIDRRDLAERIDVFVDEIRRRAPDAAIRRDGAGLHRLLIAPLQPHLGGIRELVIVPDRQLYAVPFPALHDGRRYLVEEYVVRLAPAAAGPPPSKSTALAPAVVVADPHVPNAPPLRAGRNEAARIAALHGTTLLSGDDATADRFAEAAQRSALIHYAGHANSDAATSYGALLLAGRVMSANEISRLSLGQHPLVVLAACGTFRGDAVHVAGMSSLARAFLIAGARGVVGTLWEIDDDVSAPLFLRFHEVLRAGASPAAALRAAQLEMLGSPDGRLAHPATWSPVELVQPVS